MKEAYEYDGLDTCAADGMCQEKCPVKVSVTLLLPRLMLVTETSALLAFPALCASSPADGRGKPMRPVCGGAMPVGVSASVRRRCASIRSESAPW
eukprot:1159572-Pelagomonas_calceolata.AAC.4